MPIQRLAARLTLWLPGIVLCSAIAWSAGHLGSVALFQKYGLSALTLAIMLGMIIGNSFYKRLEHRAGAGVAFSKQNLLRYGIVLYGFRLTLQDIAGVGWMGFACDLLVLCTTFFFALFIGVKLFKLDRNSVILIGAGSSICGAAAIMAADGVVKAHSEEVSVAVSTVVVFGSVAIFLYPLLYQLNLGLNLIPGSAQGFGIYLGSTIHEVAQVVAAGRSIGSDVADVAVIAKMVRVMMLAPFLLLLPLLLESKSSSKNTAAKTNLAMPWFALFFIATAMLNSLSVLPQAVVAVLVELDGIMLAMAMAALGLTTHVSAVRHAGVKPLILALLLFVWLIVGGAMINKLVFWL